MKKSYIILAVAAVAIAIAVIFFVKTNPSKVQPVLDYQDDPSEIVDAQKAVYAADVLFVLDSLAGEWSKFAAKEASPLNVVLTEKEKLIRPDYLLEPSVVKTLVTKNQKVRAIAMLVQDRTVMMAYGMPTSDIEASIAYLSVDLNFPMTPEELINKEIPLSENISILYNRCRENLELESFWEFCGAFMNESEYIIANNPDLYMGKISQSTWAAYNGIWDIYVQASDELAKYDPEMAMINAMLHRDVILASDEDASIFDSIETANPFYKEALPRIADRRNRMLTE